MAANPSANGEPDRGFSSQLETGRGRFLAHAIEHALEVGLRSPEDFIRHFPPSAIMEGLAEVPEIRASILVLTTGLRQKIAARKSWQSAAEDLQIALDERETDPESVVTVFAPDDRVRYLDAVKLWQFLIESEFWSVEAKDKERYARAKEHSAFLLERALVDGLVSHADIVEGISVSEMATCLPNAELGKLIEAALHKSESKKPFTEADLLGEMPPFVLVEYIPLPHVYEGVIVEKIAAAHGYLPPPVEPEEGAEEAAATESADTA